MQRCDKCNLDVSGVKTRCPLCQSRLSGTYDPQDAIFPKVVSNRRRFFVLVRIMVFLSCSAMIICGLLNYLLTPDLLWSIIVIFAIIFMWISMASAIIRRHNIPKNITWQVLILSIGAIVLDYVIGWHGWSLDFAVPGICAFAMIATCAFAVFMKMDTEKYLIYVILAGLLCILPLLFLLLGWLHILWPSLICIAMSLIAFCALFSFAGKQLIEEIKKRLHL